MQEVERVLVKYTIIRIQDWDAFQIAMRRGLAEHALNSADQGER